ncbi:MAG: D-alanyl-D-alanine carboxypeptidase/D-alanyl-D-alanine endopeptidase [Vulcanimicrobiaceae bacterium]
MTVDSVLARPELAQSQFGVAFYDVQAERFVCERANDVLFAGASTTKLLTCAAALHALGEDYRFVTRVVRTGEVDEQGVLEGDLVLVAAGDPNLSGRINEHGKLDFCDYDHALAGSGYEVGIVDRDPLLVLRALAGQVAAAGIRRVQGRVAVDLAAFPDAGPEPGTGVIISSIAVNDNLVDLTFTGGAHAGDPVAIAASPATPYVRFVNRLVTATPGEPHDVRLVGHTDNGGLQVVDVSGAIPAGEMKRGAYAVPSPAAFAAFAFAQALEERGVRVAGGPALAPVATDGGAAVVALHHSPPLREAVKVVLKVSQNLHAEMLSRVAGAFAAARELIEAFGLHDDGVYQGDGCGAAGTFTPGFMCRFLAGIRGLPFAGVFERALPVLGHDGTLHGVQTASRAAAAGTIHAKTGTMGYSDRIFARSFVTAKALAGYMTTAKGSHLAFAIFAQNVPGSVDAVGELLGEIAASAYESL